MLLVLLSCSVVQLQDSDRARGVYHKVRSGETLWRISQAYGVSLQDIAEVNNITDPAMVTAGTVLFIPDAHRVIDLPPVEKKPEKREIAAPPLAKGPAGGVAGEYGAPKGRPREEGLVQRATPKASEAAKAPVKSPTTEKTRPVAKANGAPKAATAEKPAEGAQKPKVGGASGVAAAKTDGKQKATAKPAERAVATAKSYEPDVKETTLEDVRRRLREEEQKEKAEAGKVSETGTAAAPPVEKKPATAPPAEKRPPVKAEPEKARKQAPVEEKKQLSRIGPETERRRAVAEEPPGKIDLPKGRFAWPVKGKVTSRYGIQANGMKNNGIRISAKEGSPVVASAAGTVIYSAPLKYYGDTILLRHDDNYVTVYANLKDRVVKKDDRVKKGDKLALLGRPGDGSDGSFLYFEIRHNNKARNPLFFLP